MLYFVIERFQFSMFMLVQVGPNIKDTYLCIFKVSLTWNDSLVLYPEDFTLCLCQFNGSCIMHRKWDNLVVNGLSGFSCWICELLMHTTYKFFVMMNTCVWMKAYVHKHKHKGQSLCLELQYTSVMEATKSNAVGQTVCLYGSVMDGMGSSYIWSFQLCLTISCVSAPLTDAWLFQVW